MTAQLQNQCPNCGELITFDEDYLYCEYCGYGCDYPYADDSEPPDGRIFDWGSFMEIDE